MSTYTYNQNTIAVTNRGLKYVIPDIVANNQKEWNQRTFPALKFGSITVKHRVKLRGDLYDMSVAVSGNIIVTRWDK